MQGDDPNYYRVISTPKHYAVHSGPESTRHKADVQVSKHDQLDTYLPAFRATVTEGKAASVMCAYNSINGQPACVNEFLLQDQLRGKWKFNGYVVSDCDAVVNVYRDHKFTKTQPEASALAVQRGMDNECIDYAKRTDDGDYRPYIDAVKQGFLKESEMDTALVRLFIARIKLGMFDPPEMVPYTKIDEKELDSDKHRALALEMANKSLVLLKNDGTLPLKKAVKKIALVGPLGDQKPYMYGNYNGTPTHSVSVLEGLKTEFPQAQITFVAGTDFLRKDGELIPSSALSTADGKPGLEASFSNTANAFQPNPEVLAKENHQVVNLTKEKLPKEMSGKTPIRVDWKGFITVGEAGEYSIGVRYDSGYGGVTVDGKRVAGGWAGGDMVTRMGHLQLEKGKKTPIEVHFSTSDKEHNSLQLIWSKYDPKPDPAAVEAAKNADIVVAVMGITAELEGEEMPVNEEGFMGGDRTSINLPKPEEDLLKAVSGAGKPVVLVLANGSALAVNWAKEHVNAIVEAWYPGEEGGTSVAQTLSGKNNPSGRLPVTFYTGVDQLPPFEDYAMKGRTYRYFEGKPLYPFGHGLSYTTFGYSNIALAKPVLNAGDALKVEATVTNKGKMAGDEVAQLYLTFPQVAGAPLRALRGFKRVHLNPGESKKVSFELRDRDLSMVSESGTIQISEGKYGVAVGGGQPGTEAPVITSNFEVKGTKVLPE
ncbi:MAG TPA: glycoside hydrolase family 3 C-terminal domain-containing protein, partial [Steroidobacteraceae bacterium]|nr:glycoside hydrolase family 3 C-terminal domain-containing protein [Steroidobacteraceae bacterium]